MPRGHGEVWKASKDGCCMYRCDNDSIVPVEYNCSTVPSPVCRRTGEMVISLADDTSCCPQKACSKPTEMTPQGQPLLRKPSMTSRCSFRIRNPRQTHGHRACAKIKHTLWTNVVVQLILIVSVGFSLKSRPVCLCSL